MNMENTKIETVATPNQPQIDHITEDFQEKVQAKHTSEELLNALYWIWDAFDRANVQFFLVHQTAEDAMKNYDLTGDKVEVGIRRNEWVSGGRRLLDAFLDTPLTESDTTAEYVHDGVTILLHNYDDIPSIMQLNPIIYRNESFTVPNPYSEFKEIYG